MFTDLNVGTAVPDQPNGWEAPAGSSVSFNVPEDWKAGRIWVRYSSYQLLLFHIANLPASHV